MPSIRETFVFPPHVAGGEPERVITGSNYDVVSLTSEVGQRPVTTIEGIESAELDYRAQWLTVGALCLGLWGITSYLRRRGNQ